MVLGHLDQKPQLVLSIDLKSISKMENNKKNCSIWYCEKCSKQFYEKTRYEDHLFLCKNEKINENQTKTKNSLMPMESSIHEGKKLHTRPVLTCSICCHTVLSKRALNSHYESVHGKKKPHECPLCRSSFDRLSNLTAHINYVHQKSKPTSQPRGKSQKCLKEHIDSVHGLKKCSDCGKSFYGEDQLTLHKKIHGKQDQPNAVDSPSVLAVIAKIQNAPISILFDFGEYKCCICANAVFSSLKNLKIHSQYRHPDIFQP